MFFVAYKYSKTVFISLLWIILSYVQALKVLMCVHFWRPWQTSIKKVISILIPTSSCCCLCHPFIPQNSVKSHDERWYEGAQKYCMELSILAKIEKNHHLAQHFINSELKLIIFTWGESLYSDMKLFFAVFYIYLTILLLKPYN